MRAFWIVALMGTLMFDFFFIGERAVLQIQRVQFSKMRREEAEVFKKGILYIKMNNILPTEFKISLSMR